MTTGGNNFVNIFEDINNESVRGKSIVKEGGNVKEKGIDGVSGSISG